jgi:hypothetical protein
MKNFNSKSAIILVSTNDIQSNKSKLSIYGQQFSKKNLDLKESNFFVAL